MNKPEVIIKDIIYTIEWDNEFNAYRRESRYTANDKLMIYAEMTSDPNAPPFTENKLKLMYNKIEV